MVAVAFDCHNDLVVEGGDQWILLQITARAIPVRSPLNSALDSWQTECIFTSELPPKFPKQTGTENGICGAAAGWKACAGDPEDCSANQTVIMNTYITDFSSIISSAPTYSKPGNGAFIHSCHTHCEAQSDAWNNFKIGGMSMQEWHSKWWNSDFKQPAAGLTTQPCQYNSDKKPRKCNKSC